MNTTIWSGRISRGYLVLPLESTVGLQVRSSCSGLVQVGVCKNRDSAAFVVSHSSSWCSLILLFCDTGSTHAGIQVDPDLSSCLPSTGHSTSGVPGAGLHQVSISSFLQPLLQLDFELLAIWAWWFTHVKLHRSFCGCQHYSHCSHPPACWEGKAQASVGIAWKTWCSNLKGDSGEHFGSYLGTINWKKSHSIQCWDPIQVNIMY